MRCGPALLTLAFAAAVAGCDDDDFITCETNADCVQGGIPGMCLPAPDGTGEWCAFPDDSCAGGSRWGVKTGDDLAGECVDGSDPDAGTDAEPPDAGADGGPDAADIDAAPLPDAGPVTGRIFVVDNNDGLFVFDAMTLQNLGTVPLPNEAAFNGTLTVANGTIWVVREQMTSAPETIVGIDPATLIVRPGFPKNLPDCKLRNMGDAGLYCYVDVAGSTNDELRLYSSGNFETVLKSRVITGTGIDRIKVEAGFVVVAVDNSVQLFDAQLEPAGAAIDFARAPVHVSVNPTTKRIAVADFQVVKVYDFDTRAQLGMTRSYTTANVTGVVINDDLGQVVVGFDNGDVTAISTTNAADVIAPTKVANANFGDLLYDTTRNRVYGLDGRLIVLDGATLMNVSASPATIPSPGRHLAVF